MVFTDARFIVEGVDTLRNPAGPLRASIYWRRRIVIIGVLLAIVAGVVWACTRNSDAEQKQPASAASSSSNLPTVPAETASPTNSVTPSPGTSGSGSTSTSTATGSASSTSSSPKVSKRGGKTLCPDSDLRVSVRTDQKFYAPDEHPKITVIVVNLRKSTCYVDMGTAAASMTIISGKDRVWSNNDCSKRPGEQLKKFASGDVYTSSVTWQRNRSEKGCPSTKGTAKPGYYVIDAKVGKAKPDDRPVFVLQKG